MDSRTMQRALLIVTIMVGTVFALVLLVNSAGNIGNNSSSKTSLASTTTEQTEGDIDESDGQINGSDLSAWMNDETFFDADKLKTAELLMDGEKLLSMISSSVEKDLRILIVNENGELVTGQCFVINIKDAGEFRDVDRDGIIYVGDMKPGDYQVTLNSIQGFAVPKEPLAVNVKASIQYCAIEDISYLIKTEDEIDAEKEDSAVNDAADETTGNSAIKTTDGTVFGIDVSKWNGDIDWNEVKKEGVKFAIIRAGYRGSVSGSIIVDPYFKQNMEGAIENNIPVGIYFYTQAVNDIEAVEEASAVLSLIKDYDITYPVFIDTEGAGGKGRADGLEVSDRSKACQAFCETIRSGEYNAGIYASKNWFNKKLDITKLSADNVTWLAEYQDEPSYGGTYQMWQYSSGGRVNGIEGRVDFNLSYLDIEEDSDENQQ